MKRTGAKKSAYMKKSIRTNIFIACMLAYPVLHFAIMWIFVNIDSVLLCFQRFILIPTEKFPEAGWNWVGFQNFELLFQSFSTDPTVKLMFLNSLGYVVVNLFIILPISIVAAYFIYKKVSGSRFYKIIFFVPSILPLIVLTLAFTMSLDPIYGSFNALLEAFGITPPLWFGKEPMSQFSVYLFCIWAGLGYNIILLSSAMGKIPVEVMEYSKLEGVGLGRELFQIVVPLCWSTITTLVTFGLMACVTVYMQPLFLTGGAFNTTSIALKIFFITRGNSGLQEASTLGIFCTIILTPIILLVRKFMESRFEEM